MKTMRIKFKTKEFFDRILFCFLLLFSHLILHSQSFNNNPAVYISDEAIIYVDNVNMIEYIPHANVNIKAIKGIIYIEGQTKIYGLRNLHNFRIHKPIVISKNRIAKKKTAVKQQVNKQHNKKSEIYLRALDDSLMFGLLSSTSYSATVSEETLLKTQIIKDNFYINTHFNNYKSVDTFSDYSFCFVKGYSTLYYTRPPPTHFIL